MRISALFAAGVVALTVFAFPPAPAHAAPLSTEEALKERILGDPDAPVEIIEYASLTCPHCAAFHADKLPEIKKQYIDTGKAKLVARDFPFDRLGAMGAMMARCANPSRYHQFIDVLFKQQAVWTRSQDPVGELQKIGKLGGLSEEDFIACMENQDLLTGILESRQAGVQQYEVNSTPTFIINGEKVTGNVPLDDFIAVIEKHLN